MTRLMVIYGEEDTREMLNLYLQKDGFETVAVEDGQDFLRKIDSFQLDIITLDLMTSGMTSKKCLDMLKKSKSKIILLTAVRYTEIEKQIIRENVNVVDYITKPIDIDDFKEKVARKPLRGNLNHFIIQNSRNLISV